MGDRVQFKLSLQNLPYLLWAVFHISIIKEGFVISSNKQDFINKDFILWSTAADFLSCDGTTIPFRHGSLIKMGMNVIDLLK